MRNVQFFQKKLFYKKKTISLLFFNTVFVIILIS